MKLCVVGTGYVGLVAGACFAEGGHDVICCDINAEKIALLKSGILPIYEEGLQEIVQNNTKNGRLNFSTDLSEAVRRSEACFIAVGTPSAADGSADLSQVFNVAREIARSMDGYRVVITKSTVPVGTADKLIEIFKEYTQHPVDVVSNPEFLREGVAVRDFLEPDRVVVGSYSSQALSIMEEIYRPFLKEGHPILKMTPREAELTKYAANAMLATKISFMNDLANLAEKVGVDIEKVREGISYDHRIGKHFLYAGAGYGGSCFPKDIKALLRVGEEYGYELELVRAVESVNQRQKERLFLKLLDELGEVKDKVIAVWGLAFKPNTDDMREAPSIVLINDILKAGGRVQAHDPIAIPTAQKILPSETLFVEDPYLALEGADALVLVTEWQQFRDPDFDKMKALLKNPIIIDGRNIYDPKKMKELGFIYRGMGRS